MRYLKNPELFDKMGIKPPHGVLLEGPPGCGKVCFMRYPIFQTMWIGFDEHKVNTNAFPDLSCQSDCW